MLNLPEAVGSVPASLSRPSLGIWKSAHLEQENIATPAEQISS
jgi:hypothetical protein